MKRYSVTNELKTLFDKNIEIIKVLSPESVSYLILYLSLGEISKSFSGDALFDILPSMLSGSGKTQEDFQQGFYTKVRQVGEKLELISFETTEGESSNFMATESFIGSVLDIISEESGDSISIISLFNQSILHGIFNSRPLSGTNNLIIRMMKFLEVKPEDLPRLKEKEISYSKEETKTNTSVDDFIKRFPMFGALGSSPIFGGRIPGIGGEEEEGVLEKYSTCLTSNEYIDGLDPHVQSSSNNYLSRLVDILLCRKKGNAIILGDPGCGKTALVEELSRLIVAGKIPALSGKKIYSLNLNSLVAGTQFRGQFEDRIQKVITEVVKNKDSIIFIDEIHNLVGSGNQAGQGDAANILKPYLARGEFQCIGTTTTEEYNKFIAKDGALKRRFQVVNVSEPGEDETVKILEKISKNYSDFHGVTYPKEVTELCVKLSGRYITDRFFPDKAIEVLDLSGSIAKQRSTVVNIDEVKKELSECQETKINLVKEGKIDEASELLSKEKECSDLLNGKSINKVEVTEDDVLNVISQISGVPVDKIKKTETTKIRDMKADLLNKVVGQDKAVNEVVLGFQRGLLGLRDINKPVSYLFVGPTGVGKTLICKEVAIQFFGSERSLIRFDMSEYSEQHQITKLTGATASYVGYGDTPGFEKVRRNPYSIVLFDEIEKAHPSIFNIFLQILDEGKVSLGDGREVDFRHCIIVFTGNIGTKELNSKRNIGFDGGDRKKEKDDIVIKAVKKQFSPEFINRLSGITIFNELEKKDMSKIFELEMSKLRSRLKEKGLSIKVDKSVKERVISNVDLKYGARDLQRGLVDNVENPICNHMLSDNYGGEKMFKLTVKEDEVEVSCQ